MAASATTTSRVPDGRLLLFVWASVLLRAAPVLAQEDTLTIKMATYPTIIAGHSCAESSASHEIYCFGGIFKAATNAPETDAIVEYDPLSDLATTRSAVLPARRSGLSCVEDSSSHIIYCFGGHSQDFTCTEWDGSNCVGGTTVVQTYDEILQYDPATDELQVSAARLPVPSSDLACAEESSTHRIYCFGGSGYSERILEFRPATSTVSVMSATLPSGRVGHSCASSSATHDIFCFGGQAVTGKLNEIVAYDPTTDTLTTRSAIFPSRIRELSCVESSANHRIYCLGGEIQSVAYVDDIYAYDEAADELTVMAATLPSGRYGLACAEDSDSHRIYCSGGASNVVNNRQIVEYVPGLGGAAICPDRDDDTHFDASCGGTDCDDDPSSCGFACNPDRLEDCDGFDNDCDGQLDEEDVCDVIPLATARLPWASTHLSCTQALGSIYCFGGGDRRQQIAEYVPSTDQASLKTATLPADSFGISCAADRSTDLIYCLGGAGGGNLDVIEYDPATDATRSRTATLPSARNRLSCVENRSTHRIYCFGGTAAQSVNFDEILEYQPTMDALTTKAATLPLARSGLSCAEDPSTHRIYCAGGYLWSGVGGPPYFREIVEYDTGLDSAIAVSGQIPGRGKEGVACAGDSHNDYIFCFGGHNHMVSINDELDFFDEILRYDPATDGVTVEGLSLPTRRAFMSCAEDAATNLIYCFGGARIVSGTWIEFDEITRFTPPGVVPVNRPPVAVLDSYATARGARLTQAAPGVLGNDTDSDGDGLSAVLVAGPTLGVLDLAADGSFVYTPPAAYDGSASFTYVANDGEADSNVATVTIRIGTPLFADGFESGDSTAWAVTKP